MKFKLDRRFTTYNDFDVLDCLGIYRACVPHDIKKGDMFNVKSFDQVKYGCTWLGDLESSLIALTQEEEYVERYLQEAVKEVKEYSQGLINFKAQRFPENHLLCHRGVYAEMNDVGNIVDVYVSHPNARIMAIKGQNKDDETTKVHPMMERFKLSQKY